MRITFIVLFIYSHLSCAYVLITDNQYNIYKNNLLKIDTTNNISTNQIPQSTFDTNNIPEESAPYFLDINSIHIPDTKQKNISISKYNKPDKFLIKSINQIIKFLQDSGAIELDDILYFVEQEISPHFDFHQMTKLSLGISFAQLGQKQFNQATYKIKTMFINKLTNLLVQYAFTKRDIQFLPTKYNYFNHRILVSALVQHSNEDPSKLVFKFHMTQNGWKIYDMIINEQSTVIFYHQNINKILKPRILSIQ